MKVYHCIFEAQVFVLKACECFIKAYKCNLKAYEYTLRPYECIWNVYDSCYIPCYNVVRSHKADMAFHINWLCKHMKNVRSIQPCISMNFVLNSIKHNFFLLSIVKTKCIIWSNYTRVNKIIMKNTNYKASIKIPFWMRTSTERISYLS